jgi:hypothetical protein
MQSPVIVFDHINKKVLVAQTAPNADKRVQEALAAQGKQVTSASGSPAR